MRPFGPLPRTACFTRASYIEFRDALPSRTIEAVNSALKLRARLFATQVEYDRVIARSPLSATASTIAEFILQYRCAGIGDDHGPDYKQKPNAHHLPSCNFPRDRFGGKRIDFTAAEIRKKRRDAILKQRAHLKVALAAHEKAKTINRACR
jgi:hypothetical protein